MRNKFLRAAFLAPAIGLAAIALVTGNRNEPTATYSEFMEQVQAGKVEKATVEDGRTGVNHVKYTLRDGASVRTVVPANYRAALRAMQEKMVNIEIEDGSRQWMRLAANASPFLILMIVWFFMMRGLPSGDRAR